ncbi:MAG: methylated-DNA--[protein]-cysteine S-methyltransferase, partial [Candidatus Binatia bacterium]
MTADGFALFDTAIGRCGIAWRGGAVVGVQLPEAREAATRTRLRTRFPGAPEVPPGAVVRRAVDAIVALLDG